MRACYAIVSASDRPKGRFQERENAAMPRIIRLAAAQMGPTQKAEPRDVTLARMIKLLEQAALSCPVKHSLHPDIEVPITWNWVG